MTFNQNYKLNSKNSGNNQLVTSLLTSDEEVSKEINYLNTQVFDFEKGYENIKQFHRNLSSMGEKEYSNKKIEIHSQIDEIPQIFQNINQSLSKLDNITVKDYSLNSKLNETLKVINSRVRPKQQEISNLIYQIVDKEKSRKDFTQAPLSQAEKERIQSLDNSELRDSRLETKDIQFNDQIMQARETELLHVQKVSSQIKDMTITMNIQVQEQGKMLSKFLKNKLYIILKDKIEDNIMEVHENAEGAESEIKKADKEVSSTTKKLIVLLLIILVIVALLVVIIVVNN